MANSLTGWLLAKLKDRLQTLLWGAVAAEVETEALLGYAADLDRIETMARQYEVEGKPQLAELLRQKARSITLEQPAGSALPTLQHLAAEEWSGSTPKALSAPAENQSGSHNSSEKRGRGRPRKGSQSSRDKSHSTES